MIISGAMVFVISGTAYAQSTIPVTPQQIDALATKSDRWMFFATLVVLLAFGLAVIRWLLNNNEEQRKAHSEDRKELVEFLKSANIKSELALEKCTAAIEESNEIGRAIRITHEEVAKLLKDDHRILALIEEDKRPPLS